MKRIGIILIVFLGIFLAGCDNVSHEHEPVKPLVLNGKTMGTTYNVKVFTQGKHIEGSELQQQIDKVLVAVNASMSPWVENSEINRFNALKANETMAISDDFRVVIAESIRLGKTTKTLDVTMGPLIDLWGFGPDKRPTKRPAQAQLDDMRAHIGVDKLVLNEQGLMKTQDGLELSLSATAKGYGIDKVALLLEQLGFRNYMVEIGGELRVSGTKADKAPWRIAIEQPDAPMGQRQIHKVIEPGDNGIATSGDYRIYYDMDGETFTHLIDPTTGMPVKHELVSVTVLHPSAMTADGLATALTVMGTERAKAYAHQHDLAVYLISKSDDGLVTYASKRFKPYL
jgi:thiamine biosynthesis lipoprotein